MKPTAHQLTAAGVPRIRLSQNWSKLTPQSMPKINGDIIDVAKQWEWVKRAQTNCFGPRTIVVSSLQTPDYAREWALSIFKVWYEKRTEDMYRPQWYCLWDMSWKDRLRRNPAGVVIDGIMPNSTPQRLMKVYDLVQQYDDCPRIVILSGIENPHQFAQRTLGIHVDMAILWGNNIRKKVSRL